MLASPSSTGLTSLRKLGLQLFVLYAYNTSLLTSSLLDLYETNASFPFTP